MLSSLCSEKTIILSVNQTHGQILILQVSSNCSWKRSSETGKPVVLVLMNGRPITINWADRNCQAIIEAWFPGKYGGEAIADIIFGDYNPGGKLPVTFPKSVGQIPMCFPFKPAAQADAETTVNGVLVPVWIWNELSRLSNIQILKYHLKNRRQAGNVEVTQLML